MRAIDQLRKFSSGGVRREYKWGDLTIYFDRTCLADWAAIEVMEPKSNIERNVLMFIQKAQDKNGKRLFQSGDKYALMHEVEDSQLLRAINFMLEVNYRTVEDAEEVLNADPTSSSG